MVFSEANITNDALTQITNYNVTNQWVHIVGVWNGLTYIKLFINGNEVDINSISPTINAVIINSLSPLKIGRRYSADDYFHGKIDDIGIWNRALSECEINALYGTGSGAASVSISGNSELYICDGEVITLTATGSVMPEDNLVISGVFDGPLSGGTPKGVELYVINNISDLSQYGIGSANNGGGSDGEEFTFPAVSATAGQYIYVAFEATYFSNWFGFSADYTAGMANINGDDAIELFHNGNVIDVFGDINVDGNGEPWEYLDGWAYRNSSTGPDGSTFMLSSWSFSGPNALDGESSNATAVSPVPVGSYTHTGSAGSFTYVWDNGVTNGVVFTPIASGDYIVVATDTSGCSATDTVKVSLQNVEIQPNNPTICFGDSVELEVDPGNYSLDYGVNCSITGNSWVDCGDVLDMPGSFSIGAWVYNNGCDYTTVLSKREHLNATTYFGYHLSYEDAGDIEFVVQENVSGGGVKAVTPIISNQWVHLVGVFDAGNSLTLYVNGVQVDQTSTSISNLTNNSAPFLIGSLQVPGSWSWDGKLDDAFIYDQALNSNEVLDIYNGTMSQNNLQGYWNFNEGSGAIAYDASSNNYNGTISTANYSEDVPNSISSINSILWSTSETTSSITVSPTQTTDYTVTVDNGNIVCMDSVTVLVSNPMVDLGDTLSYCNQDSVLLDAGVGYSYYSWNTGDTTQTIYASQSGDYAATVGDITSVTNDHSLSFDGVDDVTGVASSSLDVSNTNLLTMSAWINPNINNAQQYIFAHTSSGAQQQYALTINNQGKFYFYNSRSKWFSRKL